MQGIPIPISALASQSLDVLFLSSFFSSFFLFLSAGVIPRRGES